MDTRYLNEVAQQLRNQKEASITFERLSSIEQIAVLQSLEFMAHQAHATPDDVKIAVTRSHAGSNFRPAWMPDTSRIHLVTDKHYTNRDTPYLLGQYHYLMELYSVADTRRRSDCAGQCNHWWHHLQKT